MFKTLPSLTLEQSIFARKHNQFRSMYFEDVNNKDTLLITMGDSWTWGDSLFNIRQRGPILDDPNRVKHIYGSLIAKELNSDFINCARCGGSNFFMYSMLSQILEYNQHDYKKIIVIITLTENGREMNEPRAASWFTNSKDALNFLKNYEHKMFEAFKKLFVSYPKIKFILTRNFTHSYSENLDIIKNYTTDDIWVEVLNKHQNCNPYPKEVRFLTGAAMFPIQDTLNWLNIEFKDLMIEEFDKSLKAIEWLKNSKYNCSEEGPSRGFSAGTKHPTIEGHQLWANYLLNHIGIKN